MQASVLVERFLAWSRKEAAAARTASATVDYYRSQLSAWLAQIGLFPPDVEEMKPFHLIGDGGQTRNRIQAVKRLTRWSARMGITPADPFGLVEIPAVGERQRVLTRDEIWLLMRQAGPMWRRFIFLQRHTMCRPGEMRVLKWEMIDLERRLITFTEFKAKKRRKDRARVRLVPLDVDATRMLAAHRRNRNPGPGDHVFTSRYGKPLTKEAVRCAFRRFRKSAGLEHPDREKICSYTLRHTAATACVLAGIRDRKLADILGHVNPSTTQKYIHLAGDDLVDSMDRLRPASFRPNR
jgi:integrase